MSKVFYDKPIIDQIFEEFEKDRYNHDIDKLTKLVTILPPEDVNIQDSEGCTTLIHASCWDYPEIVKLLLEKEGIDINMRDNMGFTAIEYASLNDCIEIPELLVSHKSNKN